MRSPVLPGPIHIKCKHMTYAKLVGFRSLLLKITVAWKVNNSRDPVRYKLVQYIFVYVQLGDEL